MAKTAMFTGKAYKAWAQRRHDAMRAQQGYARERSPRAKGATFRPDPYREPEPMPEPANYKR